MFRKKFLLLRKINLTFDAVVAVSSLFIAVIIRNFADTGDLLLIGPVYKHYFPLSVAILVLWPYLLSVNRLYPTYRLRTTRDVAIIIFKAGFQLMIILLCYVFFFKVHQLSRFVLLFFALLVTSITLLKEVLVSSTLKNIRSSGRNLRHVLLAGTPVASKRILERLDEHKDLGLKVIGRLCPRSDICSIEGEEPVFSDCPVIGVFSDIRKILHERPVDHIIITIDKDDYAEAEELILSCEEEGVEIWLSADMFNITIAKLDSGDVFGMPMFVFRTGPQYSWQLLVKHLLDKIIAFFLLAVTSPILIIAALLIKATSKGPVIFSQIRSGLRGRTFSIYKLRTMNTGAEAELAKLKAENILEGPVFKMSRDPRITRVGYFLRKFSIDELPQLWNVLKGDMSLIGPRPPLPKEVDEYKGWQRRRLSMKPGITGLWQVSGRNEILYFDEWVGLDLEYIDNWSLWLDVKIFFRTIFVVLTARGAK